MDDAETEAQEVEENWGFNSGISEESSEPTELDKQLKREEQESQDEEDDWFT